MHVTSDHACSLVIALRDEGRARSGSQNTSSSRWKPGMSYKSTTALWLLVQAKYASFSTVWFYLAFYKMESESGMSALDIPARTVS